MYGDGSRHRFAHHHGGLRAMKRSAALFALLLLAACGGATSTTTEITPSAAASSAAQSASGVCNAHATRDWKIGDTSFMVDATAQGPSCAHAVAILVLRTADGRALFADAYPIDQVTLAFNPNGDATRLASDLQAWITGDEHHSTADQLPAWPEGAPAPPGFTPALARLSYEGLRNEKAAILCYPDGGESNACVALTPAPAMAQRIGSLTPTRR